MVYTTTKSISYKINQYNITMTYTIQANYNKWSFLYVIILSLFTQKQYNLEYNTKVISKKLSFTVIHLLPISNAYKDINNVCILLNFNEK